MGDIASINWRSRGYLPHFDASGTCQHVVFGLADATPDPGDEVRFHDGEVVDPLVARDADLDAGHGECLLRDHRCAGIVQDEILKHDGQRYRLFAWCVMPNHVHVVVEQGGDLPGTVRRWKSWTAREINKVLGRRGSLWQREYFDRFARNERHLAVMIAYVENNPLAAGLVGAATDWRWSSAGYRGEALAGQAPGAP